MVHAALKVSNLRRRDAIGDGRIVDTVYGGGTEVLGSDRKLRTDWSVSRPHRTRCDGERVEYLLMRSNIRLQYVLELEMCMLLNPMGRQRWMVTMFDTFLHT